MDEIEKRLRDVSETCVKTYLAWIGKKRDPETREALQDAIHELRRVSARLEIEIAVSEREEMAARPIPIPPHRSTRKRQGDDDESDNTGNFNEDNSQQDQSAPRQSGGGGARNGLRPRRSHGGGGGGGQNRNED